MPVKYNQRMLFIIGFLLLILTNIVVLMGVASNRSGDHGNPILLTERELGLPYSYKRDNSGLSLRVNWRMLSIEKEQIRYWGSRESQWFDENALKKLGFDTERYLASRDDTGYPKRPITKEVFIALEYGGEPYDTMLTRAEMAVTKAIELSQLKNDDETLSANLKDAKDQFERERVSESRLFAIDASRDAGELQRKYSDTTRYIITKGVVYPSYNSNTKRVFGHIKRVSIEQITVPLKFRKAIDSVRNQHRAWKKAQPPRYLVSLIYGTRLEPWVVSTARL